MLKRAIHLNVLLRFKLSVLVLSMLFPISTDLEAQNSNLTLENYQTMSEDGAWCWFSDPRAIYIEGKIKQIISGWVSKKGDIVVASLDLESNKKTEKILYPAFNKDDHANPSFLLLPDKRIMVFFSSHSLPGNKIFFQTSKYPEDVSEWEDVRAITNNTPGKSNFCYTNPVILSSENNRIYLFWRGGNFKPTFSFSDDLGKSWSESKTLIQSADFGLIRPYLKVCTNGIDEIHFAFTDGHPRNEPLNSIYYMKYRRGNFYRADGEKIGDISNLPVRHELTDKVYDAASNYKKTGNGVRAWIWDIALEKNETPVIVYTRLPEETLHEYYYARYNGKDWDNYFITKAGRCFPRLNLTKAEKEPEPHYSGGIYLDHENTSTVYLSRPVKDIFEVEMWSTENGGRTWKSSPVTANSLKDNVRPYVVRYAPEGVIPRLLWMNGDYKHYTDFSTALITNRLKKKVSP